MTLTLEDQAGGIGRLYTSERLERLAKEVFAHERGRDRLDGWFLAREAAEAHLAAHPEEPKPVRHANALRAALGALPLEIDDSAVFAGTQRDAFAKSYALINPSFTVATFNGYCDPTAVFDDIVPNAEFTSERIERVRTASAAGPYVSALRAVYDSAAGDTAEVAYFVEQVTGHVIPDLRPALARGVDALRAAVRARLAEGGLDAGRRAQYQAMDVSLGTALVLAERYRALALDKAEHGPRGRRRDFAHLAAVLGRVPAGPATTLEEAVQSFLLLWQVMCLEQAPNPFAFSVGNADRIFEPYRAADGLEQGLATGLFEHFLAFFNVGDRSWAISQNVILGGRDAAGRDLTNPSTYAMLDAYFAMNLPQPILSVKLHRGTPDALHEALGRFYFTPGALTPSFFNDDALFEVLAAHGVEAEDLPDYAVAGCQEPLIMGRDNGNTTNSWLNLAKILEVAIGDGVSLTTGRRIGPTAAELAPPKGAPTDLRGRFRLHLDHYLKRMAEHANGASRAVAELPVPFLSCFMGGIETGVDMRDPDRQGTKYNASGCLVHGLTVVSDSFVAVDDLLAARPADARRLAEILRADFAGAEDVRQFLRRAPKFGNGEARADAEAAAWAAQVAAAVRGMRNYLGNAFRPDFSTPSTHLIYGSLVGALPNGRRAGEMLNYGVDPLYGEAEGGLGLRVLSQSALPFDQFEGGYASHLGLDPRYFRGATMEAKGLEFERKILDGLFFSPRPGKSAPFYLYVNVTSPDTLRKVLANPKKHAPSGVYIMRIHGTFVNFLDLSPEIQEDIIKRLDPASTALAAA
jgi:formate C-acetyltransferase